MSDDDRTRWDARYEAGEYVARTHPCALLEAMLPLWSPPPVNARALDLACGAGRNAVFMASHGYQVDAVDISTNALARGAERAAEASVAVNWQQQDLDNAQLDSGYALIIVVRYADLKLVQRLPELLQPGGMLLVEAHLSGLLFDNEVDENGKPVIGGPSSERFRLAPGSLAAACSGLIPLHQSESQITDPDGRLMALAQFVGQRPL